MQRFSANLGFLWAELPLLDRIANAATAGFKAVELHFPYDVPAAETRNACAEHGVELLGLNTNVGAGADGHKGLGAVPGEQEAFKALATQAMDYVHAAGGNSVHIMAGFVPEADHDEGRRTFVSNLKWASARAQDLGLTLLLEPINQKDMPGYFYSRAEQAAEIIELVDADNVKLMFDAYHVGVEQGDVITHLKTLYGFVGHVQLAAVPSRAEPDEGTFDYRTLFAALDELGYAGWIGCEYKPRGSVEEGLAWTRKLGVSL